MATLEKLCPSKTPNIQPRTIVKGVTVLVAALSWNECARRLIDVVYPAASDPRSRFLSTLMYALTVTMFVVLIIAVYNAGADHVERRRVKATPAKLASQRTHLG